MLIHLNVLFDYVTIGLEAFDDPILIKMVESQTCGKIFAVEILEKSDIPRIILYDTSGDDDININATCLKVLQDKSLELHLQVLSSPLYKHFNKTNKFLSCRGIQHLEFFAL